MREYKRSSGRLSPTWGEDLEVVRSLGDEKATAAHPNVSDPEGLLGRVDRLRGARGER